MTATPPPAAPQVPAMRPWLRLLLIVSLALNLLVAGAVVGRLVAGKPDRPVPRVDRMGGPLTFALDHEDRRAIAHNLREEYRERRPSRETVEAEYEGVIEALRADPFDATRVQTSLDNQQAAATDRIAVGQRLLMERILAMTPAERAAFADRLEEGLERMRNWHDKREADEGPEDRD